MDSAPTFVRPATFGQLTERTFFDHVFGVNGMNVALVRPHEFLQKAIGRDFVIKQQNLRLAADAIKSGQNCEHPCWKP
jgi:hypothetical protein